jgi:hypothetical protein
MDTASIIQEIDAAISRLQQARDMLADTEDSGVAARPKSRAPYNRVFTVEGRAKIAEAQRARWAKLKRANRKAANKAAATSMAPIKKVANKSVKAAKAVKATKLAKEVKPDTQG